MPIIALLATLLLLGCSDASIPEAAAPSSPVDTQAEAALAEIVRLMQSVQEGPYDEKERYRLGGLLTVHRPPREAIAYYELEVVDNPKPQSSHLFWGMALMREQRFEEALEQYQQALSHDPAHELSQLQLGIAYESLDRPQEAVKAYQRAIYIHPEYAEAHLRLAELLDQQGRLMEADSHRKQAEQSDARTTRRFRYWARVLLEEGHVERAIEELGRALDADPNDAQARAMLADAQGLQPQAGTASP